MRSGAIIGTPPMVITSFQKFPVSGSGSSQRNLIGGDRKSEAGFLFFMTEEIKNHIGYSPEDGSFFWKKRARGRKASGRVGFKDPNGYIYIRVLGRKYRAHKLAWFIHYGEWPEKDIDHINQDKSDNRISNLRLATPSENGCNKGIPRHNRSGVKGVHFSLSRFFQGKRPWIAEVKKVGFKKSRAFHTRQEAVAAIKGIRESLHGIYSSHS